MTIYFNLFIYMMIASCCGVVVGIYFFLIHSMYHYRKQKKIDTATAEMATWIAANDSAVARKEQLRKKIKKIRR